MHEKMRVKWERNGGVRQVECAGARLPLAGPGGFSVVESLMPDGQQKEWGPVAGRLSAGGKAARFEGAVPQAALELTATVRQGDFIDVRGEVRDTSGADRALEVTFTLPVNLKGWRWESTAARAGAVQPGCSHPSDPDDFIYLGKKGDGFANEEPERFCIRTNKLPYLAVCRGARGLALAYPLHEPRVFRLQASEQGLAVTFSLGLTPITQNFPSRASFRFILYAVDGTWGLRAAAERYAGFFPELFRTRCKRHGNIASLSNPEIKAPPAHVEDMGIAYIENDYQWTDGEMAESTLKMATSLGVKPTDVFHWRGPWYWFHEAPGDITRDAQLARMKAQAEGRLPGAHGINNQLCGCPHELSAKAAFNSHLVDHQGKLERIRFEYPQYSCWLLPMNMDPNLPKPNRGQLATEWQYRYIKNWKKKGFRGPFGIAYDAFDDFSGFRRLNFRRDHLAVMNVPATFDPVSGRVCQVKGFHDWSWARVQSAIAHKAGGKVMANINLEHAMMFGGQFVDVVCRERRSMDHDDERLSVHRMLMGGKPIALDVHVPPPATSRAWLREARRLLVFGMAPGGNSALWQELSVHMRLLARVAEAGWQPVPYARANGLWIERFGNRPGRMYLAVRNPGKRRRTAVLTLDAAALGLNLKRAAVRQISPATSAVFTVRGSKLMGRVNVAGQETIVLAVTD